MATLRNTLRSNAAAAVGAISGVIPLAACPGGSCASCFGCAGIGVGVLLLLIMKNHFTRSNDHGMAETGS
jgi:hypothetical protein